MSSPRDSSREGPEVGWRVPAREELLPVDDEQHCVICGSPEWSWLLLLLRAPEWVQQLGWFINWFVALCDGCAAAWQADVGDHLRSRWEGSPERQFGAGPTFDEYRAVLLAMQSEPPLPRSAVTAG